MDNKRTRAYDLMEIGLQSSNSKRPDDCTQHREIGDINATEPKREYKAVIFHIDTHSTEK